MQSAGPQAVLVPSDNHPYVIAGQGTVALEMLEQVGEHNLPFVMPGLHTIHVTCRSVGGCRM